ncbi:hypothetical protein [Pedobacter ureilyticus]|uniref:Phage tail protein n=1 Tax=Pedobacter ureilyticus TaxID=1393051 RepID=A0ABW9J1V2_9SPHI|nr:hypothetical protein [Pedobacter helvus]
MAHLDVNTSAVIRHTERLERLNRSAFPVAVRQTLNDAAFDVKNRTLNKSADKNFTRRSPNFFKTFSKVEKAIGFNVNSMRSIVGMSANGKQSAKTAINNMEKQEQGGRIKEGAAYLKDTRGGNNAKTVRKSAYFASGRKLKKPRGGRNAKSQFIANAFMSKKQGAKFSVKTNEGRYLIQITSIRRSKNGEIKIKSRALMKERRLKPANIKATRFMSEAADMSSKMIETFYVRNANKQFARVLR